MNVVFATERLSVRRFTENDAAAMMAMESEPDTLRYVGRKALTDVEAYRQKIRTSFLPYYERSAELGAWAVVERASGEFIGACSLRPAGDSNVCREMGYRSDDIELGYGLRKPSWGRGYATEIALALVHRAFTAAGASTLVACVTIANVASVRVLEKAGFQRCGEPIILPGETEPSVKYELSREEFEKGAVRSGAKCRD